MVGVAGVASAFRPPKLTDRVDKICKIWPHEPQKKSFQFGRNRQLYLNNKPTSWCGLATKGVGNFLIPAGADGIATSTACGGSALPTSRNYVRTVRFREVATSYKVVTPEPKFI